MHIIMFWSFAIIWAEMKHEHCLCVQCTPNLFRVRAQKCFPILKPTNKIVFWKYCLVFILFQWQLCTHTQCEYSIFVFVIDSVNFSSFYLSSDNEIQYTQKKCIEYTKLIATNIIRWFRPTNNDLFLWLYLFTLHSQTHVDSLSICFFFHLLIAISIFLFNFSIQFFFSRKQENFLSIRQILDFF